MFRLSSPQHGSKYDWQLKPGRYTAGRDPLVNLVINDSTVSRKHAQIEVVDIHNIRLTDLGSLNGTHVNDKKVTGTVDLKAGDSITFGNVGFLLSLEGSSTAKPALSISDIKANQTSITALPMELALSALPMKDYTSPTIFKAISDMAKMLILPQTVEEMFNEALDLLKDIVKAERIAIFQAKDGSEDVALATFRLVNNKGSQEFVISRSILKEVLTNKNAVLFSDLISDERFAKQESIVISGIRSAMAVPMVDEGKVLGVLYVDTTDPLHRYNEESLKVTATFGNILAAKLTNHNLLKERQQKEALEAELTIASQIQEQLMPKTLPEISGYDFHTFQMQCKMVGGDLYDVARMADGRVLFMLADVSGKGMGAALLASNILSAFRILRGNADFDVAEATARVSDQLHQSARPGDFATLFVGVLSPQDHTLTYVNAGHNPPILVRANGTLEYIQPTGIPIGIFGAFSWEEKVISFGPEDKLVVFTDGIPEATNGQEELYSDERLEKFVIDHRTQSLSGLTTSLIEDVSKFVGDAPRSDDITMILLRRAN
jgi:serine phosphatase RsbU (regulator of sigma subunit)